MSLHYISHRLPILCTTDGGELMSVATRFAVFVVLALFLAMSTKAQPVQNGFAAVTCFSDFSPTGPVVALIDVTAGNLQPVFTNWNAPKSYGPVSSPWNRSNLGEVFGIAFDGSGNIYVSATTAYTSAAPGGPGGSGAIYQLNGVTGAITTFVSTLNAACGSVVGTSTIPNTGNGLGNIAYDPVNNQFFATNMEDGKIYRISSAGIIQSTFDPFGPDGCTPGPAPLGERIWGIGIYNNRVYFARWQEDCGSPSTTSANEVWSIGLAGGDFTGGPVLEITVPPLPSSIHSNPVADIAFSAGGRMLLAERTMVGVGTNPIYPNAHASRVLEYQFSGTWGLTGNIFDIGTMGVGSSCGGYPTIGANSAGGVDYAYGSFDPVTRTPVDCDSAVWASGDALKFASGDYIYGFQRLSGNGGNAASSQMIDADGNTASGDKTQIGDIEIYKRCAQPQTDPCKDIQINYKPVQSQGDASCCFDLTISGIPAGAFTQVSATLLTASVSMTGVIGPTGWNVTNTGTFATWDSAGVIPAGTVTGLRFCLYSLVPPPQEIEITLYAADGTVCKDTIRLDCAEQPPPLHPCMTLVRPRIECTQRGANGSLYDLSFAVTNQSIFSLPPYNLPAENIVVYPATSGVTVTPNGLISLSPTLGYNQTSNPLNFTIGGSGLKAGDTVCIVVQLHGKKLEQDYQWCCPPDTLCVILPPCKDCCDSVDIAVKERLVRQVGNNAANISSSVSVTPGPVMAASATIVSVTRSTIWCPKKLPNGGWVYVQSGVGGPMLGQISNATLTPALPLSSGLTPPSSQVIWGTTPAGVDMSSGSIGLQLSFPGTTLGWRCRDTLTVCVRYTFTDTACRTCDTVVCYQVPRRGQIAIKDIDLTGVGIVSRLDENPSPNREVTAHEVTHIVQQRLGLSMSSTTAGLLSVGHWWQDDLEGDPTIRFTRMLVTPEPGVEIVSLTAQGSGTQATVADRTATIALDLNKGETDLFDIQLSNPRSARFFVLHVRFEYTDGSGQSEPELSREFIVTARVPGENGGDLVLNDDISERPVGVRTFMLYFVNNNVLKQPISQVDLRVKNGSGESKKIIAVGPPPEGTNDPESVELYIFDENSGAPRSSGGSHEIAMNAIRNIKAVAAPGDTIIPIIVTISDVGDNPVTLTYTTYDENGTVVSEGEVELNDPLTTSSAPDENSRVVTGISVQLYPVMPNPGSGDRTIRFRLDRSEANLSVALYDVAGREISKLVNEERFAAGTHTLVFNPSNLSSGTYYVVLKTGTEQISTTMQVVE